VIAHGTTVASSRWRCLRTYGARAGVCNGNNRLQAGVLSPGLPSGGTGRFFLESGSSHVQIRS
jgi:hypothetical protein